MTKCWEKVISISTFDKTLDVASKILLFHTYILSQFEYCSLVWHLFTRDKTKKIGKIQKRAMILMLAIACIVGCLRKLIDR